jgi:1,4-dihydroxy-2-naphthoate octaprenyltransferase
VSALATKAAAWLRVTRLPFYPAAWAAYTLGAAAAVAAGSPGNGAAYAAGYACIFLLELCTVYCNELFDLGTDRLNKAANLFTGGSRMVVEGRISEGELKAAILVVLALLAAASAALLVSVDGPRAWIAALLLGGLVLGPGYTVPPLRLVYRGLGELDVAIVFGPYLVLSGFLHQAGSWDAAPWLLTIPLSASILPGIILAGVIDHDADRKAGKGTLAVILGPSRAIAAALALMAASAVVGPLLLHSRVVLLAVPHAALAAAAVVIYARGRSARAVAPMMALCLSYVLWFAVVPLVEIGMR